MSMRKPFSRPELPRIVRHAKIRTRMLDHSGTTTSRNISVRQRTGTMRAMNQASGNASATSTAVTIAASSTVRP